MTAYVLRRLLLMLPVAFLVTVGVFLLIHLSPGDPALIILGEDRSPQAIAQIHQELGLDKPLYVQYVIWLGHIVHGDWGRSITTHQPVAIAITERLPATFELGLTALLWSLLVAIPLGTIAAVRRGSVADQVATGITVAGVSIPNFFIGIVLIFLLSVSLRMFPFGGYVPFFQDPLQSLRHVMLPAIALGTAGAAINMRFTRSSMIEVLNHDYIRTARAKGASWRRVVFVHALKNALIPVVTIVGLQIGGIIEGAVVTETVFTWPGVGRLAVESIFNRDYTVVQGIVLLAALFLVAILSPLISPHDPLAVSPDKSYLPPLTPGNVLGTDELGRDLLSRILWGSRVSLPVAFVAVAVGLFGGGLIGLVSGYAGGIADLLLMRLVDALLAFPGLILAIAVVAALGPGLRNAMIAIGIVAVPVYARLVRAVVLQLKQMEFIVATRSLGATPLRLVVRHLIPNLLNPIIVQVSLSAGFAILAEATLSFLGLGAQLPTPDWGQMINSGASFLNNDPWLAIVPGAAISITVYSFNLLGDSLRDALDPRLRS